jgi:dUTP pyrophosphatase
MCEIQVKKLHPEARLPGYATEGSAGMDLHACMESPITLKPGAMAHVSTGLAFAIPFGFEGQVRPRSGLAFRHGITVVNTPGTIDSDYRGEIKVALINLGGEAVEITPGERIAQIVISAVSRAILRESKELDDTDRGAGGFGHTGRGVIERGTK